MSPERPKSEYFTNFESPCLPDCTWRELIENQEALSPRVLIEVLTDARDFLTTEPGPNLARRQRIVPLWINYWTDRLEKSGRQFKTREGFVHTDKIMAVGQVASYLERTFRGRQAGVLNVAGAEGHAGHVFSANFMAKAIAEEKPMVVVWAFEQDGYLLRKERKAPFFPLVVRLSMWNWHCIDVITVLPEKKPGISDTDHYQAVFDVLGVKYSFAGINDPNKEEKIGRGAADINTVIPYSLSPSTTDHVRALMPDPAVKQARTKGTLLEIYRVGKGIMNLEPEHIIQYEPDLLLDGALFKK